MTDQAPRAGSAQSPMDQTVLDLLEAVALQESALSEVLSAESQKMKAALAMDGIDLCKLLEMNDSATKMVHAVANLGLLLTDKLEFIVNTLPYDGAFSSGGAGTI